MANSDRLKQYEAFKRENDEHLLVSLTNLYPHNEKTLTVRANIAIEIFVQKFTIAMLLKDWTERHRKIEQIYADLNKVPSPKLDDKKAIRKAAIGRSKKGKVSQSSD